MAASTCTRCGYETGDFGKLEPAGAISQATNVVISFAALAIESDESDEVLEGIWLHSRENLS